jgi:hypothetical protein
MLIKAVGTTARGSHPARNVIFTHSWTEQIIIAAGVVLIAIFALKATYAQFCSNCSENW